MLSKFYYHDSEKVFWETQELPRPWIPVLFQIMILRVSKRSCGLLKFLSS